MAITAAEKRQTAYYKAGIELCGIRGLGLPTKNATVVKLCGNEVELKFGSSPNIIIDLSRLPSSAHWTVHQTQKLEIRTGDKLLLGKNGECVTIAEFSNGEPVSDGASSSGQRVASGYAWHLAADRPKPRFSPQT